ncbi:MAG: NUDIX domain-containing protein [Nocardioidaceae bacterium]
MERDTVDCVGGIVRDDAGRLLLIRRGTEPAKGCWSVPGGRVEDGEDDATATAREVLEETGLAVVVGALAGAVRRDGPGGVVYAIRDYHCRPARHADPAAVRAGDDADDVGWFRPDQVRGLRCSPGLVEALEEWAVLP